MEPIPEHLKKHKWYAPHLAWLRQNGLVVRHDPGSAPPIRAYLRGANLRGADLRGADLRGADPRDARLQGANLRGADLRGADLRGADPRDARLQGADLRGVDLRVVDLQGANLEGANVWGATLPDGRMLEEWQADPLAGLCDTPEATERAVAAWGNHSWADCPMHAAYGWGDVSDAPEDKRGLVATFVALFDGGLLPRPVKP